MFVKDIQQIVELQKASFPIRAAEGVYWKSEHIEAHLKVFPQGQVVAEYNGKIVGSSSTLILTLEPEYKDHTWNEACGLLCQLESNALSCLSRRQGKGIGTCR